MTDYYVKNGGSDGADGLSDGNAWETLAKADNGPYNAGDNIYLNKGDEWREVWGSPSAGSDGNPITLGTYGTGNDPIINGSSLITGWVEHDTNVWKATLNTEPGLVAFDRSAGTNAGAVANIDAALEWFWTGNELYVYSTSDADTAFTSPGIEASTKWVDGVGLDENYVDVDGIHIRLCHESGIFIDSGITGGQFRNCEINLCGFGIKNKGVATLIELNNIHDLSMVTDTQTPGGDDYGAIGVQLQAGSNHEIRYNTFTNCTGHSYDYGTDGGALEISGTDVDGWLFHHNWVEDCRGILEIANSTTDGARMYYNVFVDSYRTMIHLTGGSASTVTDFRFENNTVVERNDRGAGAVIWRFNGDPNNSMVLFRNNIVYSNGNDVTQAGTTGFLHTYNCYHLYGGASLIITLSTGEIEDNPDFTDQASDDFTLQSVSPCVNAGTSLGYTKDYSDNFVFFGAAPDMGAYESAFSDSAISVISGGLGGTVV